MKRKVIIYISMSLDGYIADKNGSVDWLAEQSSTQYDYGYSAFLKTIDTILMGKKTYDQIITELSAHTWPYAGKKCYVFTHKKLQNTNQVTFCNENICDFVSNLKKQKGEHIWVCGGAVLAHSLIKNDSIDQYHIFVMPILLGGGISLFQGNIFPKKLHLLSVKKHNDIVEMVYQKKDTKR